jgi:hypothetical protein
VENTEKAFATFVISDGDGALGLEITDIARDPVALAVEPLVPADGAPTG